MHTWTTDNLYNWGPCPGSARQLWEFLRNDPLKQTRQYRTPRAIDRRVEAMSTTEALRTQLDALQSQLYALEAENRRLREDRPERAEMVDLEVELKEMQEQNIRLSQRVSELSVTEGSGEEAPGAQSSSIVEQQLQEDLARSEEGDGGVEAAKCGARHATGVRERSTERARGTTGWHGRDNEIGRERSGAAEVAGRRRRNKEVGGTRSAMDATARKAGGATAGDSRRTRAIQSWKRQRTLLPDKSRHVWRHSNRVCLHY